MKQKSMGFQLLVLLAIFTGTCTSPDMRSLRKPFISICVYSHLLGDNFDREYQVVLCPEKITHESEWFGLAGPVARVYEGSSVLEFDKQGRLQKVTNLFSNSYPEITFVREGKFISFLNNSFSIKLDENGRIKEWTKRCMQDCRMLRLNAEAGGKESYYHYPIGTLLARTTYTYSPGGLHIAHEEFDYINATAEKPGKSLRLITEKFTLTERNTLTLSRKDRIGPVGSKISSHKKEWNLTWQKHKATFFLPDPAFKGNDIPAELPVVADAYGNWIQWGPGTGKAKDYIFQRKIFYH